MKAGLPRKTGERTLAWGLMWDAAVSGTRVYGGCENGAILCEPVEGSGASKSISAHGGPIKRVEVSWDSKRLVSCSNDGFLKVWTLGNREPSLAFSHRGAGPCTSAAFSPDSRRILGGFDDKSARLFDLDAEKILCNLRGHNGGVRGVALGEVQALTVGSEGTLLLWDLKHAVPTFSIRENSSALSATKFVSESLILSAGEEGLLRLYDQRTSKPAHCVQAHEGGVKTADARGHRIVTCGENGVVCLFDTRSITRRTTVQHEAAQIASVKFYDDENSFLSLDPEGIVQFWTPGTQKSKGELIDPPKNSSSKFTQTIDKTKLEKTGILKGSREFVDHERENIQNQAVGGLEALVEKLGGKLSDLGRGVDEIASRLAKNDREIQGLAMTLSGRL